MPVKQRNKRVDWEKEYLNLTHEQRKAKEYHMQLWRTVVQSITLAVSLFTLVLVSGILK